MKKQPTKNYSKMSKKELEAFARDYGLELDKRLKKDTLVRIVESTVKRHNEELNIVTKGYNRSYYGKLVILTVVIAIGILILRNYL